MAPPAHMSFLDDHVAIPRMQEQSEYRRPEEKQGLHDSEREAGLQHGAGFVHIQRERVVSAPAILAERAEGDPDGATVPV